MSEQETSQAIRTMAEELTGLQTTGSIEKLIKNGKEGFKVRLEDGFLLCLRNLHGWDVGKVGQDGKVCRTYTSCPGAEAKLGKTLVDLVLNDHLKLSADFVFEKGVYEIGKEIQRFYYKSDIGKVILHLRRLPESAEGVIEVKDRMIVLRFGWNQLFDRVDIGAIQRISSVPF